MSGGTCPSCADATLRGIDDALAVEDIDRAIACGLLDAQPFPASAPCPVCAARATRVAQARDARLRALAARDRFRARQARIAARAEARARRRAPPPAPMQAAAPPALPTAAAAALARAMARAAAKRNG